MSDFEALLDALERELEEKVRKTGPGFAPALAPGWGRPPETFSLTPREELEIRRREARARSEEARLRREEIRRREEAERARPDGYGAGPDEAAPIGAVVAAPDPNPAPSASPAPGPAPGPGAKAGSVAGSGPFSRLLPKVERWAAEARKVDEERERERARAFRELRARWPLYVRFGGLPPRGRSAASLDMREKPKYEDGISVFRARRGEEGAYVVDVSHAPAQNLMYRMLVDEGRPVYLATGTEVASGSDGEPLLGRADVRLEPLPEGSLMKASGEWEGVVKTVGGGLAVCTLGLAQGASWTKGPLPEVRIGSLERSGKPREMPYLVEAVLSRSRSKDSRHHGPEHWKRVAVAGARLAERTPGADRTSVLLFAVLHDSMRVRENLDTWHGFRAAEPARSLLEGGPLLPREGLARLLYAIEHHDAGKTSADPTVSVCWDSDRLDLWRAGVRPDPALLSTAAAKDPETIAWARGLQARRFTWLEVLAMFPTKPKEEADGDR